MGSPKKIGFAIVFKESPIRKKRLRAGTNFDTTTWLDFCGIFLHHIFKSSAKK
jgi:hypothetical protein